VRDDGEDWVVIEFVWEFVAKKEKIREFEQYYSEAGPWAELFARNPGYRGTVMLRDADVERPAG